MIQRRGATDGHSLPPGVGNHDLSVGGIWKDAERPGCRLLPVAAGRPGPAVDRRRGLRSPHGDDFARGKNARRIISWRKTAGIAKADLAELLRSEAAGALTKDDLIIPTPIGGVVP